MPVYVRSPNSLPQSSQTANHPIFAVHFVGNRRRTFRVDRLVEQHRRNLVGIVLLGIDADHHLDAGDQAGSVEPDFRFLRI